MKNTPQESNDCSVRAIIRDSEGRHLLLKRSKRSRHFPGMWEWPGGKAGPGEGICHAVKREVLEETGLATEFIEMEGKYAIEIDGNIYPVYCILSKAMCGCIQLSDEHEQAVWVAPKDFLAWELTPGMRAFIECHAEKIG